MLNAVFYLIIMRARDNNNVKDNVIQFLIMNTGVTDKTRTYNLEWKYNKE